MVIGTLQLQPGILALMFLQQSMCLRVRVRVRVCVHVRVRLCVCVSVCEVASVMSNSLRHYGL